MQAGLVYGQIGQTEYIVNRVRKETGYAHLKVVNANAHRHQPLRHIALNAASERVHDVWHDACYNGALDRFRIDMLETDACEEDILYDEISSGLLVREIRMQRQELLESLSLFYRVFVKAL